MKVLHFYKTYFPDTMGGLEQSINQLARSTANLGVTVDVLSLSPGMVDRTVLVDGHRAHRCRSIFEIASTPFSASAFLRFRQLARKADIIHYHFPYPFADVLHFATGVNKPSLITYHSDIIKQKLLLKLYAPLRNCFMGSVDHIVVTSPNYLESSDVLSKYKNKTSVIQIGLDKATYPVVCNNIKAAWKERFDPRFFLFIGVIRYYKGLHILVEAVQNSSYPIVIVGAGPVEKELKEYAAMLGISNIHFLGYLPDGDKVALLELCYAVVFPSHLRSEAFGISLLEGAMYGKPLISSEIGTGTSFVNINEETGVVVPPGDPAALRKAMDYLWSKPEHAKAMGKRAESRYSDLFTSERMALSYVELYRMLLEKGARHGAGLPSGHSAR